MARYLTDYFLEQTLRRGKGVGQFLGFGEQDGVRTIRYLVLYLKDQFELWCLESYDLKGQTYDLTVFPEVSTDEPMIYRFDSLDEAIDFARKEFAAQPEKWVNASMLGDEYADALEKLKSI